MDRQAVCHLARFHREHITRPLTPLRCAWTTLAHTHPYFKDTTSCSSCWLRCSFYLSSYQSIENRHFIGDSETASTAYANSKWPKQR